jgi:hypothetical protein
MEINKCQIIYEVFYPTSAPRSWLDDTFATFHLLIFCVLWLKKYIQCKFCYQAKIKGKGGKDEKALKNRHNQTFGVDQNNHRNTLIRYPRFLSFLLLP